MSAIDELLHRQENATRPSQGRDTSVAAPAMHVAVVTCMDARIQVPELFGIGYGEAHILRNAGGIVTEDVIRSLTLSQRELGTREVLILGHTSCGMSTITEDGFKDDVESAAGVRPTWAVEAFDDVAAGVLRSVRRARHSPFLPHTDRIRGFVHDVHTGTVTEAA